MSDFIDPKKIQEEYEKGLIGAECDPEDLAKLLGESKHPLFGASAYHLEFSGEGKLSLPFKSVLKFVPDFGPSENQTTGDCQNGSDLVRMADGSTKPIKDIAIGDYVISAFGNKCKVTNTIKKPYNGKMVKLTLNNYTEVSSTPDHKYIIDNVNMKMAPIVSLKPGDKVFMPQINHVEDNIIFDMKDYFNGYSVVEDTDYKKKRLEPVEQGYIRAKNSRCPIRRFIRFDEKLAWMLGVYAAEGGIDGVDNKCERITFNLGGHEHVIAEQIRLYMKEIFDVDAHVYQVPSKPTVIYVRINSVYIAGLFKHLVSGNTYTKSLAPETFITSQSNKLAMIKGWIDGDGHQGKYNTSATSVSKHLVLDFANIANSVNLKFSILYQDKSHDPIRQDRYTLNLRAESSRAINLPKTEFVTEIETKNTIGQLLTILETQIVDPESQYVYCIEVEKDHTFICNGVGISNCVSHSTRNAVDITRAVEIDIKGEVEGFVARGATEGIYQSRSHRGQGMSCSTAARYVSQNGGILLRKDYGNVDLSKYNSSLGSRKRIPNSVFVEEARKHQVQTISLVTSIEEARDALANGYALSCCSGLGFSSSRDENGIARRRGRWAHAMACIAADDTREIFNETLFLIQNSWGRWNRGPKRHGQPDGSFWIRQKDMESILRARGSFVFSDVDGFPARQLPEYGLGEWL